MDTAIEITGLGKKFRRGQGVRSYVLFREILSSALTLRKKHADKESQEFWALQDITFSIKKGEIVGIIGRNGAGKSTLLKILSRIIKPTLGEANIFGRTGSLLEVGTGFHPELTGRENIYFNGAILGMRRREIKKKFDEIVSFSELERFIDTPLKYYSSGMSVRLAFAVAAHLNSDILFIDEILAVGDASFQRKCLGKMEGIVGTGRTIIFVSHNLSVVKSLCKKAILLDEGKIVFEGQAQNAIQKYLSIIQAQTTQCLANRTDRTGSGRLRFLNVRYEDGQGREESTGMSGQPLEIVLEFESQQVASASRWRVTIEFINSFGETYFYCSTDMAGLPPAGLPLAGQLRCLIPRLPLTQNRYYISIYSEINGQTEDWVSCASYLDVIDGDFFGTGIVSPEGTRGSGVLVPHHWKVNAAENKERDNTNEAP